nr:AbrB/MazE/SpoVT family DNA-binding domain-containing protein [Pseudomonas sp.]
MNWKVAIQNWDGEGAIRIPDEALHKLDVNIGENVYLLVEYLGNAQCLVLSKTPEIPDRTDELVSHWDRSGQA